MPQSLSQISVHSVFSSRHRESILLQPVRASWRGSWGAPSDGNHGTPSGHRPGSVTGGLTTCTTRPFCAWTGWIEPNSAVCIFGTSGSKNQGGAYVAPYVGGMYAPSRQGRRHARLRHVCATRDCFSWGFAGRGLMRTDLTERRSAPAGLRHATRKSRRVPTPGTLRAALNQYGRISNEYV